MCQVERKMSAKISYIIPGDIPFSSMAPVAFQPWSPLLKAVAGAAVLPLMGCAQSKLCSHGCQQAI